MNRLSALACALLLAMLAACGGGSSESPPSSADASLPASPSAAATAPSSATPVATVVPTPLPTTSGQVDDCRLPTTVTSGVGLGFPVPADRITATGTVRAIAVLVDFSDAPAARSARQVFSEVSPAVEEFFTDVSYGTLPTSWMLTRRGCA